MVSNMDLLKVAASTKDIPFTAAKARAVNRAAAKSLAQEIDDMADWAGGSVWTRQKPRSEKRVLR